MSGFGHVDLWYLVTPTPSLRETFVEAFAEARRAGEARFAAITTHGLPNHIGALVAPGSPIDAVMLVHNFASSPEVSAQIARLHAAGLAVTPMKPLAGFSPPGSPASRRASAGTAGPARGAARAG